MSATPTPVAVTAATPTAVAALQSARTARPPGFGCLARCPECHSPDLEAVLDGSDVNFYCPACARCWHVEFNRVARIDPATCYGCGNAPECRSRFAADHDASPVGV